MEIIKYLKKYYKNYKEIVKSFVNSPSLNIRVNTYLTSKEELKNLLKNKGIELSESNISKDSLIISNPVNITELDEFKDGLFTIQDEASALVAEIVNPKEGSLVLDLCAAPGSKSTHLLQIMNNNGKVYSNDVAIDKLDKIKENFERLKLDNYEIFNYDATERIKEFENKFDYILIDAPCSGLGVIKRKPEIKINRTIKDIKSLTEIQKKIIDNAYYYLKNGGKLVYSTCTLGRLENQDIIDKFLKERTDMKLMKFEDQEYIQILPNGSSDGFFISKILKNI